MLWDGEAVKYRHIELARQKVRILLLLESWNCATDKELICLMLMLHMQLAGCRSWFVPHHLGASLRQCSFRMIRYLSLLSPLWSAFQQACSKLQNSCCAIDCEALVDGTTARLTLLRRSTLRCEDHLTNRAMERREEQWPKSSEIERVYCMIDAVHNCRVARTAWSINWES